MIKRLYIAIFLGLFLLGKAQCPQVLNYLGVPSSNPYWLSCSGSSVYVLNFQSPSSWGTYTINWGDFSPDHTSVFYTGNSIINHTYTTVNPDTFVVTLNVPSLSCTMTGVVVMEKPVVSGVSIPIGGTTAACAPAALQFSNASTDVSETTKFIWNYGDGSPPVQLTYTNAGTIVTHTYLLNTVNCQTAVTLSAWNYCSLGSTAIATYSPINIYQRDNATLVPDKFVTCWPNSIFTFSNTTSQSCLAQGNNFQRRQYWNLGNYWGMGGDSIHNWTPWPPPATVSVSYLSIGTYSVMLRDSNLCGVDTGIINITILNPPTASVVAPAGPLCQNSTITFTNASSPGYTYYWNFGAGGGFVNLGAGNKSFTYAAPGTYTVQLAAAFIPGGAPCTNTSVVVINILPQPVSSFTFSPGTGCTSLSAVGFTDTSTGANAWNWNFGNLNTSTLQVPPAQNYTTAGVYTISLAVTGTNTCMRTSTASLVVYPTPTANFNPTIACLGIAVNFTNTSTITGTNPIISYTWNLGDGSPNQFIQNAVNTYTAAGNYTVDLTVSSAFCSASISKTLTINIQPTANFTMSPNAGCSQLAVTFTNNSSNGSTYLWNFGTTPTNTSNLVTPNFTYTNNLLVNQIFTITLVTTSSVGCVDSIKRSVTVFPTPQMNFTMNPVSGCSPLAVTFTNNTLAASSYTWNFGDGNNSGLTNPSHTYTNAGVAPLINTVQLVATNSLGCTNSSTATITINPVPSFTLGILPLSGCSPLAITFPTLAGAVSYTWNFGDGSPVSFSTAPTHVFTNTTLVNVNYTVNVTAANIYSCTNTASAVPTIFFKPSAGYTTSALSGCSPLSINFTNTSTGQNSNNWNFNNGQSSVAVNASMTFTSSKGSSANTYSVKLVVGNINNCKDSVIKTITLFAYPKAQFDLDTPACSPKLISFTNTSVGGNTYVWDMGTSTSSLNNPSFTFTNGTTSDMTKTVSLVAINSDNCKDTVKVSFVLHPQANFNITSSPDSGCASLRVNFSAIAGVKNYNWSFGDGSVSTNSINSKTYLNNTSSNKVYTAQLIAFDANNCSDTIKKLIKVFPKPVALFSSNLMEVVVPSQALQLTNQSTGASTYSWTFGDGGTSSANSPSYNYQNVGEYVVTLIAVSDKNCKDTFALADKIIATTESGVQVPNAFTPNTSSSSGSVFDPKDKSNDIFHPVIKNVETYNLKIFSRWGELLFETSDPKEGWDGYFRGKLCTQDVYVWKIYAKLMDGRIFDKAGDLNLLIK